MFNLKFNPEYGQMEGQFKAKVVSLGNTIMTTSKGKPYVVGTIQFANADGEQVERSAICYEANKGKIVLGETYLCNIVVTQDRPNEPIISISPLTNAVRATADDFGFDATNIFTDVNVGVEETV